MQPLVLRLRDGLTTTRVHVNSTRYIVVPFACNLFLLLLSISVRNRERGRETTTNTIASWSGVKARERERDRRREGLLSGGGGLRSLWNILLLLFLLRLLFRSLLPRCSREWRFRQGLYLVFLFSTDGPSWPAFDDGPPKLIFETTQYNTIQYNAIQCNAKTQCNTMQCCTIQT